MITKTCLQCGNGIKRRWPHELDKAVFCGNPCKFEYQRIHPTNYQGKQQTRRCAICTEVFEYYPSVQPNAQYCSDTCRHVGHSEKIKGRRPSNGIYTSSNTFRVMIREYFVDRCAVCGWDAAPNDVCHIVARKDGGADTFENVVMLCPNHHRLFHKGVLTTEQVINARPNCLP